MAKRSALDANSQKTHYVLAPGTRKRAHVHRGVFSDPNCASYSPFSTLLAENHTQTAHRYALYERVWAHQLGAIQRILNSANDQLFGELLRFVLDPFTEKLPTAFLGLSSNTANNLRILDEFTQYVGRRECPHVRIVSLSSKVCFNIKAALREVVKQVLESRRARHDEDEAPLLSDDEEEQEKDSDEEYEDLEDDLDGDGGKISYDFEIVENWVKKFRERNGDGLRIVIVLEDSDGFSNEVLNQLVQLFCVFSQRSPIKLIMALSSKNVSDWINSNITSQLRTLVAGCKLEAKDNKDIGFQVIDDILLQNEITPENPLLLDARLSLIVLNRFENSNNSIDSLITELKLTYMIHFYQLPLSALVDGEFEPDHFHVAALRKLPSFKTHLECLLHRFTETSGKEIKQQITSLIEEDAKVLALFKDAQARFQKYQNSVMNAIHIVYMLSGREKHKFQIYKLVTNNQLINSVYLSEVLKRIKAFDHEQIDEVVSFIHSGSVKETVNGCSDTHLVNLRGRLTSPDTETLLKEITTYLHTNTNLNMKISDNLFNEVLTINGGLSELDELKPVVTIEENYENLMINLIRPKLRDTLENALEEPQRYLRNGLVLDHIGSAEVSTLRGPILSRLYQVYKDAPVNINIWDFFVAFKLSLLRRDIVAEIRSNLVDASSELKAQLDAILDGIETSDEKWDRLVYAWFLQSSFELVSMGFLREKTKGDYVEKMVWRNL